MIHYEEEWIYKVAFRCKGSVAFAASCYALPPTVLALLLQLAPQYREDLQDFLGLDDLTTSQTYHAATAVVLVLLAHRTFQALSRFWEGTSLLHQMRGEWFDSVSCLVAFSRGALEAKPAEVQRFRHTIVRLMSLCHGSALEEIADGSSLFALDVFGLDKETLRHLKECKKDYGFNRVECLLHLFQVLVTQGLEDGLVPIAPPILSRVYQTLSRGFVNLLNAKKIKDVRFPFPFAQLIAILLFAQMFMAPLVMVSTMRNEIFSCLFTFLPVFGTFSLNFIAGQLENPFGSDDNDLPLVHFQKEMNNSLLMLLHKNTDLVANLSSCCIKDFKALMLHAKDRRRGSVCDVSIGKDKEEKEMAKALSDALVEQGAPEPPVVPEVLPETRILVAELEPKLELLAKRVEEFRLSLPGWTRMLEMQVLELGRSFGTLQNIADVGQADEGGSRERTATL